MNLDKLSDNLDELSESQKKEREFFRKIDNMDLTSPTKRDVYEVLNHVMAAIDGCYKFGAVWEEFESIISKLETKNETN